MKTGQISKLMELVKLHRKQKSPQSGKKFLTMILAGDAVAPALDIRVWWPALSGFVSGINASHVSPAKCRRVSSWTVAAHISATSGSGNDGHSAARSWSSSTELDVGLRHVVDER